jgi:hypothetical protein
MKKLFFLMILAGILLVSCSDEKMPESFDLGVEKSFHIKGEYQSSDSQLKFSITNIDDSRCPSDVTCVWEGKADVTIAVESPQPGTIILSTYNNLIDTVRNFSFELKGISPYPVSTETIDLEDYDVKLKIVEF